MRATNMPDRWIAFIDRTIGIEKPDGFIVAGGDNDHLAGLFNLITAIAMNTDEPFFCHCSDPPFVVCVNLSLHYVL